MYAMGRISDDGIFFARGLRPCPRDFDEIVVRIGRLACQEHYHAGRATIDRWLEERGKARLIEARAERVRPKTWRSKVRAAFLAELSNGSTIQDAARKAGVGPQCVHKWRNSDSEFAAAWDKAITTSKRLGLREIQTILHRAFPVGAHPTVARLAAQHLRIARNGGFRVSPMMSGGWMVGLRRVTSEELVDLAISRGFDPSLTGDGR